MRNTRYPWIAPRRLPYALCGLAVLAWAATAIGTAEPTAPADPAAEYTSHVRSLIAQYCLSCHSQKVKKGDPLVDLYSTDLAAATLASASASSSDVGPALAAVSCARFRSRSARA